MDRISRYVVGGVRTEYTYDSAGNRESEVILDGPNRGYKSYVYDSNSRLQSVNGARYSYDANGNLLLGNNGEELYTYDLLNRQVGTMQKKSGLSVSSLYSYDGESQRFSKSTGNDLVYYGYINNQLMNEVNGKTGEIQTRNIYGHSKPIERIEKDTNKDYNLLYDGIGSISLVDRNWITDTAANGGKFTSYNYGLFGEVLKSATDLNNVFAYKGYVYEKDTNTII